MLNTKLTPEQYLKEMEGILKQLPEDRIKLEEIREILLANTLMLGEIPAPTFEEQNRMQFLCDRFTESGLLDISIDEAGNAAAVIPGTEGEKNILIVAHADTPFDKKEDHTFSVSTDRIIGPGVADNSLGLAAIASLPHLLHKLKIKLKDNLILMGNTASLGYGNLHGLRFFLENNQLPLRAAILVEGVHLGRLSYSSLGMIRGQITCNVPAEYDWTKYGMDGSIGNLTQIIRRLLEIRLPRKPRTSIILGSVRGGMGFNTISTSATLKFELRSESDEIVEEVHNEIEKIVTETAAETSTEIQFDVVAKRNSGGIPYSHPLVTAVRDIMEVCNITPKIAPSTGGLGALVEGGVPAVTVGLTQGGNLHESNEYILLDPLYNGLAQLTGLIKAIDKGICDDKNKAMA